MDTKALRQKILDLAIRGKLVPQEPNDEPASVLLERIREQKKQMVKDGKLKAKDIKNDTVIFVGEDSLHYEKYQDGTVKCIEDEIPFEVPEGWEWARLGSICDIVTGKLDANAQTIDGEYPFFTCGEEVFKTDLYAFDCNAILLGGNNATGDFKMHRYSGKFNAYQRVYVISAYLEMDMDYLYNHIRYYLSKLQSQSIGSQTRYLKLSMVTDLLIALPSLREQRGILEVISKYLNYCELISNERNNLSNIIKNTKSKILDLAIRGKLVPQDPNDEPASVLLECIRNEKEKLIKQGKIKREKKESLIFKGEDNSYYEKIGDALYCIDEEILYEIPDTWEWVRLENCCIKEIRRGKSPKYVNKSNTLVFAQKCNTKYNGIDISLAQYLDEKTLKKYPFDEYMQDGDIVINSTGTGTLGRVGIYHSYDNHLNFPIVPDSHVTVIRTYKAIRSFYIYAFMKANQFELEKKGEGSTNQKELKPYTLKEMLVPLPPYNEQIEIIKLLTHIFSIMSMLEKNLK